MYELTVNEIFEILDETIDWHWRRLQEAKEYMADESDSVKRHRCKWQALHDLRATLKDLAH